MNYFELFLISIISLSIGSFLNFYIYRFTSKTRITISSRSICPNCKKQLFWYHNIPLLSYLFLKGKCGFCKDKISIQYPLVEFITMFLGIYIYKFNDYSINVNTISIFFIFVILLTLSIIDLKIKVIPEYLSIVALFIAIFSQNDFLNSSIYALSLIGFFYIIKAISEIVFKREIFGEGDLLIFGIVAAILINIKLIFNFFLLTSLISIIYFIFIYFQNKGKQTIIEDSRFNDLIKLVNMKIHSKINKNDYVYQEKLNILKNGLEDFKIKDNLKAIPFIPFLSISLFLTYIELNPFSLL